MLNLATTIHKNFHFKPKFISIDNIVFKMHYRLTCWMLLLFMSLLCLSEYNKMKIKCTHSDPTDSRKQLEHVIDTFCFFMATFTIAELHNTTRIADVAWTGVGPHTDSDTKIHHKYYQWVPYVLFLQGLAFYLPHYIWRQKENGRLKALVEKFSLQKCLKEANLENNIKEVQDKFKYRIQVYNTWLYWLIGCEFLNLLNLIAQVFLTNWFLSGEFLGLGKYVYNNWVDGQNPLDRIFPKTAKCNFQKFGPTGTLQIHDVVCVLTLNTFNEKIYLVLWYWYIILGVASVLVLLHRLASMLIYSTGLRYNARVFNMEMTHKAQERDLVIIMKNMGYSEWFFLQCLCTNMDGRMGVQLLHAMADSYENPDRVSEEDPNEKKKLKYEHKPTQVVSDNDVKEALGNTPHSSRKLVHRPAEEFE